MSARVKLIVAGLIALVVCAAFYFFFVRPRSAELDRTSEAIVSAENERTSLAAQLKNLQELREDAPNLQASLNEFRELVPSTHDLANFMLQVQDTATASGVPFIQIDPEEPRNAVEGVALGQVRATIAAQGGYFSIQDFIRRMNELDRAVSIETLQMSAIEGDEEAAERGRISVTLVVRIFFEVPEQQAPITTPGADPAAPAPAATTPAPADGTTPAPADPEAGTEPGSDAVPADEAG